MIFSFEPVALFLCGLIHGLIFALANEVGLYNDVVYTHVSLYVAVTVCKYI